MTNTCDKYMNEIREFFGYVIDDRDLLIPLHFSDSTVRQGRKCGANRNCNYPTLTILLVGGRGYF